MIAIEKDKGKGINRRRYVGALHQEEGAFVLFDSVTGIGTDYVNATLRAYQKYVFAGCEFLSVSRVFGERDLAMEVVSRERHGLEHIISSLKDDPNKLFKNFEVFPFSEDEFMRSQGLPWSDAKREAYIPSQLWVDPSVLLESLADINSVNYRIGILQIYGSASYNTLVIVSSEPKLFEESEENNVPEIENGKSVPPLKFVGMVAERIRATAGVDDMIVYPCSDTLDFYLPRK